MDRIKRILKEKKNSNKNIWKIKFREKIASVHKRKLDSVVDKILKRIDSTKNSMVVRSRKNNVECTITIEELRQLVLDSYGSPCKYCGKILTIKNMVFDHIVPMSKNGPSNKSNIQIICKTSNGMKGSLDEESFYILLNWLKTIPENLSRDISIRLARGIH